MRLLFPLIIALTAFTLHARRQQTTVSGKLPAPAAQAEAPAPLPADTVRSGLAGLLAFAGYDKPLTASRETMHVSNLSDSLTVTTVTVEITYLDRQNRQLHKRQVTINTQLTPGETTLVSFPTWDPQRSFYYILSAKPRRQATPYSITLTPLSATVTSR